ncbi:MAG TPA: radical SAM protein [Gemmatimonadaceae bacterium]|nr:radical SAM protein [Gemmatimonadaceae bacterium]
MRILRQVGDLAWNLFQAINTRLPAGTPPAPTWAPGPLLKSHERSSPPLGYPRETDSLCPRCVIETRRQIIAGTRQLSDLVNGHVGEIRATLYEEDGQIRVRKSCPEHGTFEDLISIDAEFSRRIESRFPGRDYRTFGDSLIHRHGTSSIRFGRGAVLTIDLTNRCNMMCNPCFMDANQVGYVHELSMEDVKRILDDSISFKPRRQMSVQFSGGEPTLSPHFLEACSYAKELGYMMVQAATNGLRFALEPDFAFAAKEAGFDMAYLQFDGVTNEANSHRHISNLFDLKLRAIENLYAAGIRITPVTTIVNTVNERSVGPIVDFCMENFEKMGGPAFQPVSFTGRDEEISDEARLRQRYTTSHLAHDLRTYYDGKIDPLRDWFPLSVGTSFAALTDHLRSPEEPFGQLSCSCHPNCGAAVMLVANGRTKAWAPVTSFFDLDRFLKDVNVIIDSGRGRALSIAQVGLSFLRNFDERKAPSGLTAEALLGLFNKKLSGALTNGRVPPRRDWRLMWIGSMWFQDLWTYDFRRTEMCVIPYGTQEGEISFCAYNTGVGWRQIVENMHMVATTRDWFKTRGRHPIYAGNRPVPLPERRSLRVLPAEQGGGAAAGACGRGCGCH